MPPRSPKSSPAASEVIDAEFREVDPIRDPLPESNPRQASSNGSPQFRRAPVSIAVPARGRLLRKRSPASATAVAECPVCGKRAALGEVKVAFITARVCPRCVAFGNLGMLLLRRML